MSRHVTDQTRVATPTRRLLHFLRIERRALGSRWSRAATELWFRSRHDPAGRTLVQFAAIDRGREV